MTISVLDTLELSVPERIRLVAEIWESIAETPDAIVLTAETRQLLAERLATHRKCTQGGSTWSEVKARLEHE